MPVNFPVQGDDAKPDSSVKKLQQFSMGIPLLLSSAPSSAGGQLAENTWGFFGSNMYVQVNGSCYKISLTLV